MLRYFDLAAPLHHEDEERHVFALLAGVADAELEAAVARLRRDHARMESLWAGLRTTLEAWSRPDAADGVDAALRRQAAEFGGLYAAHMSCEEELVFAAARARIDDAGLSAMSADMQQRRRAAAP